MQLAPDDDIFTYHRVEWICETDAALAGILFNRVPKSQGFKKLTASEAVLLGEETHDVHAKYWAAAAQDIVTGPVREELLLRMGGVTTLHPHRCPACGGGDLLETALHRDDYGLISVQDVD